MKKKVNRALLREDESKCFNRIRTTLSIHSRENPTKVYSRVNVKRDASGKLYISSIS